MENESVAHELFSLRDVAHILVMCKDADRLFSNWHVVKFHTWPQSLTNWDIWY